MAYSSSSGSGSDAVVSWISCVRLGIFGGVWGERGEVRDLSSIRDMLSRGGVHMGRGGLRRWISLGYRQIKKFQPDRGREVVHLPVF
jgi:hypothetical protein